MAVTPLPVTYVAVGETLRGKVICRTTELALQPTQFLETVMKSYSMG